MVDQLLRLRMFKHRKNVVSIDQWCMKMSYSSVDMGITVVLWCNHAWLVTWVSWPAHYTHISYQADQHATLTAPGNGYTQLQSGYICVNMRARMKCVLLWLISGLHFIPIFGNPMKPDNQMMCNLVASTVHTPDIQIGIGEINFNIYFVRWYTEVQHNLGYSRLIEIFFVKLQTKLKILKDQ